MRVVFVSVFDDGFGAFVGVAVFAEVRAGGVSAYVISEETGAALSCLVGFDVWASTEGSGGTSKKSF